MNRVSVIGTTGSGKSTLACCLAQVLDVPHIELDAIHWRAGNWTPIPPDQFKEAVAEAVRPVRWVVEGGYSVVRPLIWERADTVVWLDYSFPVTFSRLLRRSVRRVVSRDELWGGNRETLALLLSRESILLWCLKTHHRNRRKFRAQLACPESQHLRVLRFQSPRHTERWLGGLRQAVCQRDPGKGPSF